MSYSRIPIKKSLELVIHPYQRRSNYAVENVHVQHTVIIFVKIYINVVIHVWEYVI
eukprot:UN27577